MTVLFVARASPNTLDRINSTYKAQAESLEKIGVNIDFFLIDKGNLSAYIYSVKKLKNALRNKNYDLVHAHYGLSAFIAILQNRVKVIATFHGSDIHNPIVRLFSFITTIYTEKNIFVSKNLMNKLLIRRKSIIIPCGVDISKFYPIDKNTARTELGLLTGEKYVLFAGLFEDPIKNYSVAKKLMIGFENTVLLEVKNLDSTLVNKYLNAVDLLLMTSKMEGSPQIIKEAMACNCPIVSTNVGDVISIINGAQNCYVCNNYFELNNAIKKIFKHPSRSNGRYLINNYLSDKIAERIYSEYIKIV